MFFVSRSRSLVTNNTKIFQGFDKLMSIWNSVKGQSLKIKEVCARSTDSIKVMYVIIRLSYFFGLADYL